MLRETSSCFSFTGTRGLGVASCQLSEVVRVPQRPTKPQRGQVLFRKGHSACFRPQPFKEDSLFLRSQGPHLTSRCFLVFWCLFKGPKAQRRVCEGSTCDCGDVPWLHLRGREGRRWSCTLESHIFSSKTKKKEKELALQDIVGLRAAYIHTHAFLLLALVLQAALAEPPSQLVITTLPPRSPLRALFFFFCNICSNWLGPQQRRVTHTTGDPTDPHTQSSKAKRGGEKSVDEAAARAHVRGRLQSAQPSRCCIRSLRAGRDGVAEYCSRWEEVRRCEAFETQTLSLAGEVDVGHVLLERNGKAIWFGVKPFPV